MSGMVDRLLTADPWVEPVTRRDVLGPSAGEARFDR